MYVLKLCLFGFGFHSDSFISIIYPSICLHGYFMLPHNKGSSDNKVIILEPALADKDLCHILCYTAPKVKNACQVLCRTMFINYNNCIPMFQIYMEKELSSFSEIKFGSLVTEYSSSRFVTSTHDTFNNSNILFVTDIFCVHEFHGPVVSMCH